MKPIDSNFLSKPRDGVLVLGRWSVLLCLFAVPINKPATNIFILLAFLCAVLGSRVRQRCAAAARQPVVIGAAVWMAVLLASALYAVSLGGNWAASGSGVFALLYPFIVATLFETPQWRTRGMLAFALGVGFVLLISWGQFIGVVPQREVANALPSMRYTVFKDYTPQGMAFLVLASMAAAFALTQTHARRKWALWLVAAAAAGNVVFLLQSRTSYLVVVPLFLYGVWRTVVKGRTGWRGISVGFAVVVVGATVALLTPNIQQRLVKAVTHEVTQYETQREPTSTGIRLELWKRTLPIIASAPLLGHGLGQWQAQYMAEVKDLPNYSLFEMGHPHQEALLILSEQGAIGLLVFILLLIALARYIQRLDRPYRDFYNCSLLIYVTAGLANCLWADFSHRHLFIMLLACIPFVPRRLHSSHQHQTHQTQSSAREPSLSQRHSD